MIPRVAFVNGGILGLLSYAKWLRRTFADDRDIHAEHVVLTEQLSLTERITRRVLCQRLWPDPRGWRNVDLARFRHEYHAGLQARRLQSCNGDFVAPSIRKQSSSMSEAPVPLPCPTRADPSLIYPVRGSYVTSRLTTD